MVITDSIRIAGPIPQTPWPNPDPLVAELIIEAGVLADCTLEQASKPLYQAAPHILRPLSALSAGSLSSKQAISCLTHLHLSSLRGRNPNSRPELSGLPVPAKAAGENPSSYSTPNRPCHGSGRHPILLPARPCPLQLPFLNLSRMISSVLRASLAARTGARARSSPPLRLSHPAQRPPGLEGKDPGTGSIRC
jgi:hypothetical protein